MMDNLSADMIQCRKDGFGCHYGHWKAQQERKPIKEPEVEDIEHKRICQHCGKAFYRFDKRPQRYCSDLCRQYANYRYVKKGYAHGKSKAVGNE